MEIMGRGRHYKPFEPLVHGLRHDEPRGEEHIVHHEPRRDGHMQLGNGKTEGEILNFKDDENLLKGDKKASEDNPGKLLVYTPNGGQLNNKNAVQGKGRVEFENGECLGVYSSDGARLNVSDINRHHPANFASS